MEDTVAAKAMDPHLPMWHPVATGVMDHLDMEGVTVLDPGMDIVQVVDMEGAI